MSFKDYYLKSLNEQYQGEHEAPDKSNGAPFYNVEGIYPKDFYSIDGRRYYATEEYDSEVYNLVVNAFKRPNLRIIVYRAVPKNKGIKELNKGDWVTPVKKYAIEHGKENLNNNFSIISKNVHVRDLFTDGNSLVEWGYDPQPEDKEERLKATIRRNIKYLDRMINGEKIVGYNKYTNDPYYGISKEVFEKEKADIIEKYKNIDYLI